MHELFRNQKTRQLTTLLALGWGWISAPAWAEDSVPKQAACQFALSKPDAGKFFPMDRSRKTAAFLGNGPDGKIGIYLPDGPNGVFYALPPADSSRGETHQRLLLNSNQGRPEFWLWRNNFDPKKDAFENQIGLADFNSKETPQAIDPAQTPKTVELFHDVVVQNDYWKAWETFVQHATEHLLASAKRVRAEARFSTVGSSQDLPPSTRKQLILVDQALRACRESGYSRNTNDKLDAAITELHRLAPAVFNTGKGGNGPATPASGGESQGLAGGPK